MRSLWRQHILEVFVWLMIEVLLNFSGFDQLGNYSEFVFTKKNMMFDNVTTMMMVI
jgi:hypothetical protein